MLDDKYIKYCASLLERIEQKDQVINDLFLHLQTHNLAELKNGQILLNNGQEPSQSDQPDSNRSPEEDPLLNNGVQKKKTQ